MAPILTLNRVSKHFGAIVVARDIDLELGEGEALGMLGPNGAGKTTLFGMITGTITPNQGTVTFDGHDVTRLSATARCRLGMARSFQVPQPFAGMTVFENCVAAAAFARGYRESAVYTHAAQVLQQCGLAGKANAKAGTLTLLDRKRLELARALATRPRLLLLDEVAGGLSEPECALLIALIKDIRATGISLIWIEHVIHALMAVVDRVVVLSGGAFIANDTPEAAIRHPKVAEVYMGIPAAAASEAALTLPAGEHHAAAGG